jgi:hypothetical protein
LEEESVAVAGMEEVLNKRVVEDLRVVGLVASFLDGRGASVASSSASLARARNACKQVSRLVPASKKKRHQHTRTKETYTKHTRKKKEIYASVFFKQQTLQETDPYFSASHSRTSPDTSPPPPLYRTLLYDIHFTDTCMDVTALRWLVNKARSDLCGVVRAADPAAEAV